MEINFRTWERFRVRKMCNWYLPMKQLWFCSVSVDGRGHKMSKQRMHENGTTGRGNDCQELGLGTEGRKRQEKESHWIAAEFFFNASNTLYWMLSALFVYKLCIIFSSVFVTLLWKYLCANKARSRHLLLLPIFMLSLSLCPLFVYVVPSVRRFSSVHHSRPPQRTIERELCLIYELQLHEML